MVTLDAALEVPSASTEASSSSATGAGVGAAVSSIEHPQVMAMSHSLEVVEEPSKLRPQLVTSAGCVSSAALRSRSKHKNESEMF